MHRPLIAPQSWCALLIACAACAPPAAAQTAQADASSPGQLLRSWLTRINDAARLRNFQGTFVVSGGGSVTSSRIVRICESGDQYERIDPLDGQARQVFRHNDQVHTLWPGKRVALVEKREWLASFPSLVQSGDDQIAEFYEVVRQDNDRVAGYEANVLWIQPRDAHRFGFRLWAERATGMLLRADVLGERNEVIETAAFSDLVIGVKHRVDEVLQPMRQLDGYKVLRPALTPTTLEAEGWTLRQAVPGFRQVRCVKRPVDMSVDGAARPDSPQMLQAIYSDGLTHVSVFIEPFDVGRHGRALVGSIGGATSTLMRRHGDAWLTVIGDVPVGTLRMFAQGLERSRR